MSDIAGKGCEILVPFSERKPLPEIERSLIKTYRKHIWTKFLKAIREFNLIEAGDKVAVGVSGGKDSMLMAKLFQELQKHGEVPFELEFIAMDPGYHENIKELLIENCKYLEIPIHLFESGIFKIVDTIAKDYPCYMCAKMRRGALYSKAMELGCNKLALGRKIISQSVQIFTDVCPECGRAYTSGGKTTTTTKADNKTEDYFMDNMRKFFGKHYGKYIDTKV